MIHFKLNPIERSIISFLKEAQQPHTPQEIAAMKYVEVKDWKGWRKILDRLADCGFILKFNGKYGYKETVL